MNNADDTFRCSYEAFLKDYVPPAVDQDVIQGCIVDLVGRAREFYPSQAYKTARHTEHTISGAKEALSCLPKCVSCKQDSVDMRSLEGPSLFSCNCGGPMMSSGLHIPRDCPETTSNTTNFSEVARLGELRLMDVIQAIWEYAAKIAKRRNQYRFELTSDYRDLKDEVLPATGDFFMDAYICDPAERDTILPVVIEMKEKTRMTIHQQVVDGCIRLINKDPRRVFIYAITAEGPQMTIWYFSQLHIVQTTSFNWSENNIVKLIRVILAFAFASPEELGRDPHVHKALRNQEDESQQFVYEYVNDSSVELDRNRGAASHGELLLDSESTRTAAPQVPRTLKVDKIYFKTIKQLDWSPSSIIIGRTTRVWLVKEVTSSKGDVEVHDTEPVVLKETWISTDARTEAENLEAMFHALDKFVDDVLEKYGHANSDALDLFLEEEPKFRCFNKATRSRLKHFLTDKNYKDLFLTTLYAWKGQVSKPLSNDAQRPDGSLATMDEVKVPSKSVVTTMRQHRFVYKEVCTPCYRLPTFGDAMDILRQCIDALYILYCANWVHRDISCGNILAMGPCIIDGRKRYQVKLSDFEVAQPINRDQNNPDLRTGTALYMPVEIRDRTYFLEDIRKSLSDVNVSNGQAPDHVIAFIAACDKRMREFNHTGADTQMSHWGISPEHPLFMKLGEFNERPDLLPVPNDATLDIPDRNAIVNYNYQHDLESIWWIILHLVTSQADHKPSKDYARRWFRGALDSASRHLSFTRVITTDQFEATLKPEFQDVFPAIIEILRDEMHTEYLARAVYGRLTDDSSYSFIHGRFAQGLDVVLKTAGFSDWAKLPMSFSSFSSTRSSDCTTDSMSSSFD